MKDTTPQMMNGAHPTDSLELPEQQLGMERELPMQAPLGQSGVGEAVMELIERMTQLPFHAQLSVLRMMAPRILEVMDGRDRDIFLKDLHRELTMDDQDIQGT